MWFAATRSFRAAMRMWQKPDPALAALLKPLGGESLALLQRFAGDVNAVDFKAYGVAQIILGAVLLLLLLTGRPRDDTAAVLTGAMLILVLILAAFIAPAIGSVGRIIHPSASEQARFWTLHGAYIGLDGAKLLGAVALAARWIWKAGRPPLAAPNQKSA